MESRPAPCIAQGNDGWTLIELALALTIGGILLAMAAPSSADWIAGYQLAAQAQRLATSLTYARAEAIKRGQRVNLCRAADGRRCSDAAGWEAGWIVHVDANRDARSDADEPLLRSEGPAATGVRVVANRPLDDYVSFTGAGNARLVNGGLQMGTFIVCRRGLPAQRVVLANSGRVRIERTRDVCD